MVQGLVYKDLVSNKDLIYQEHLKHHLIIILKKKEDIPVGKIDKLFLPFLLYMYYKLV